ncbi:hypothetical protein NL676_011976 [Syzygium grande]|nr:hypothetical protein NL676_011976 [Syzygium grande]
MIESPTASAGTPTPHWRPPSCIFGLSPFPTRGVAPSASVTAQSAALTMAAHHVFDKMPELVRPEAFVEMENGGSQRVLEKLSIAIPHPQRRSI